MTPTRLWSEREVVGSFDAREVGRRARRRAGTSVLEQDADTLHLGKVRLIQSGDFRRHSQLRRSPVTGEEGSSANYGTVNGKGNAKAPCPKQNYSQGHFVIHGYFCY